MCDRAAFVAVIMIIWVYCLPMLKRIDELENRISKIENMLDHIEKALYIMPEEGDQE